MIGLIVGVVLVFLAAMPAMATERFVSPTGTGSTCSSGSPCSVATAIAASSAGDIVTMQDGTYTGANAMVSVLSANGARNGTSSLNVITVRAQNEGMVTVDGGFARYPVELKNVSFWTIEGINAKNGLDSSFLIWGGSSDITVRRVVAWDTISGGATYGQSGTMWACCSTNNVVFEDVAVFGMGRKTFALTQGGHNTTVRRLVAIFQGSTFQSPMGVSMIYNNTGATFEDVIAIYSPTQMPDGFVDAYTGVTCPDSGAVCPGVGQPAGTQGNAAFGAERVDDAPYNVNSSVYGLIALNRDVDPLWSSSPIWHQNQGIGGLSNLTMSDAIAVIAQGNSKFNTNVAIRLENPFAGGVNLVASHISSVHGTTADVAQSNWTVTNHNQGNCVTGSSANPCTGGHTTPIPDPWTTTSGANMCYRHVSGARTTTPLWPWPMNQRIIDAMGSAGSFPVNNSTACPTCTGSVQSARVAIDVTAIVEAQLGTIPSACRTSPGTTPNFPVATDFPNVAVLDTFDRANASELGANWTNLEGSGFAIASNLASPGAVFTRAIYTASAVTKNHEVHAIWPTIFPCCGFSTMLSFAGTDQTVNNQYRLRQNRRTGGQSTQIEVVKVDSGGNQTTVISAVDLGLDVVDTNGFGVRVSSNVITVYWKWTDGNWYRVAEMTDNTLPTSDVYVGIAGISTQTINDFGAGPLPTQPPIVPPNPPGSVGAGRFGTTLPGVR